MGTFHADVLDVPPPGIGEDEPSSVARKYCSSKNLPARIRRVDKWHDPFPRPRKLQAHFVTSVTRLEAKYGRDPPSVVH